MELRVLIDGGGGALFASAEESISERTPPAAVNSVSAAARLWAAISGGVGPSPELVPATMGLAGVLLWLAFLGRRHGAGHDNPASSP